jgi:hypothetical protein
MINRVILFSLCFCLTIAVACKKATKPNTSTIDFNLPYKVQTFLLDNVDQTAQWDGHQLQFGANNTLQASKNGLALNGFYSSTTDSLTIRDFSASPYSLLNGTWKIVSITPGNIDLSTIAGNIQKRLLLRQY